MAITQADIDAIEQSLVDRKGALSVTFEDQTINFGTIESYRAWLADMKRQVGLSAGPTTRYIATSKDV
jgi:hypothetical protein